MGWAVIWVYRAMLTPIYPELQSSIGPQSNAALGMIASWYFLGYTALQIPVGYLMDRFGQKKILVPGFALFALSVLSMSFAKSITAIYVAAFIGGIGCCGYYGAAFSLTSVHVPPDKKGLQVAIVNSGTALGLVVGLMGSSYLVKYLGWPWQTMVIVAAVLLAALTIWFALVLVELPKSNSKNLNTKNDNTKPLGRSIYTARLMSCYFLYFVTCYAYYLLIIWLPKYLETERHIQGGMLGLMVSMIAVTSVPGALFFARMSDQKRDQKAKIIFGLAISAFILITLAMLVENTWSITVVLLAYGFLGKISVDPVLLSYVSDNTDARVLGTTFGTLNFFGMSSSVIAPVLSGYIIDSTGSSMWGFYLGALLVLLGAVVFYWVNIRNATTRL